MTPQFILTASLCREPHCASEPTWKDTAKSEIENLGWAPDYAERGYTAGKGGVLLANWNYFPRDIARVLDRAGFDVQWSDEWSTCDQCNKLVRTSPDCYGWQPYYIVTDGELACLDCVDWESYLESIEDNPRSAVVRKCNPAEYGYRLISEPREYENGFHPGQNDDPRKILQALQAAGHERVIFRVPDVGQFDVHFEAWERIPE